LNCGLWVAKSHPDIDRYFPYSCRPVVDMNKCRLEINNETLKVRVKKFDCWQKMEAYCGID
jgi:hypothetical protein